MVRAVLCSGLVVLSLLFAVPSSVSAADGPGGANLLKLAPGEVGADSLRIRVQHDPAIYVADSWKVLVSTPGAAGPAQELACDWGATGAPGNEAGLFYCDLFNLPEGNHFFTLEAVNANRTDSDPNTYLWHTVGPATGIVNIDLPGSFATAGAAGTWAPGDATATPFSAQRVNLSWQPYTTSAKDFPAVGYFIEVTTPNGTSRFVADRTVLELFLTPATHGEGTISIYPVTSRGLVNHPQVIELEIENRVADFRSALTIDQIVGAANYDVVNDPAVLRYYVAFFNRQPDLGGAKYWLDIRRQGFTAGDIAGFMAGSDEFANNYAGTTDREYLTQVYTNVLGRDFDQDGFIYWLDTMQGTNVSGANPTNAQISRSEVVFFIAQSVEFTRNHPFGS